MGKPKVKAPKVPPPAAIPEVGEEPGEEAIKKARRRGGFEKTLITGSLTPKAAGKRVTLG